METPNFDKPFVVPQGETGECRKLRVGYANATRTLYLADLGRKFILACAHDDSDYLPENNEMFERLGLDEKDLDGIDTAMEATKDYADEFVGVEVGEMRKAWEIQHVSDDEDIPF